MGGQAGLDMGLEDGLRETFAFGHLLKLRAVPTRTQRQTIPPISGSWFPPVQNIG